MLIGVVFVLAVVAHILVALEVEILVRVLALVWLLVELLLLLNVFIPSMVGELTALVWVTILVKVIGFPDERPCSLTAIRE